ncbi:uncharacterized protein LODBEIA_P51030 [Lodderomyces beijingensis]|uniref:RING-type E3 ubiquitin transferase n=1 Tax=Lodderomyces beijingensis TaxID=1775926 RepID=A0ABP0ZSI1_9ASCO
MFSSFKSTFGASNQPKRAPRGKQIRSSSYRELIPHVENDIIVTMAQLRHFDHNSLFNKLILLMETSHRDQKTQLQQAHRNQGKSEAFYQKLFELRKNNLDELSSLLSVFKNNHSMHSLQKARMAQPARSHSSSISSKTSASPSVTSRMSMADNESEIFEDAPDHLLDPISFELFTDPVLTPSGITYEKETLLNHLNKKGRYDPISKQELRKDQIYPNLLVKESVEAYKRDVSAR